VNASLNPAQRFEEHLNSTIISAFGIAEKRAIMQRASDGRDA
jgi:hypothetical protein